MHSTNAHGLGVKNDVKTGQIIKTIEEMGMDMKILN